MTQQSSGKKIIAKNRRVRHEYELLEIFEAGLVLTGTEIKSVRANRVSLARAYVQPRDGELWLVEAHIAEYEHGNVQNHEPTRPRKLLLHRREINKILDELGQKGLTAVPTSAAARPGEKRSWAASQTVKMLARSSLGVTRVRNWSLAQATCGLLLVRPPVVTRR